MIQMWIVICGKKNAAMEKATLWIIDRALISVQAVNRASSGLVHWRILITV